MALTASQQAQSAAHSGGSVRGYQALCALVAIMVRPSGQATDSEYLCIARPQRVGPVMPLGVLRWPLATSLALVGCVEASEAATGSAPPGVRRIVPAADWRQGSRHGEGLVLFIGLYHGHRADFRPGMGPAGSPIADLR
jgi:hypothetical protein